MGSDGNWQTNGREQESKLNREECGTRGGGGSPKQQSSNSVKVPLALGPDINNGLRRCCEM